jgi:hypothetical protein
MQGFVSRQPAFFSPIYLANDYKHQKTLEIKDANFYRSIGWPATLRVAKHHLESFIEPEQRKTT